MSFSLNGTSKQLAPHLRYAVFQLIKRKTCKIAVQVDNNLLTQLENNEIKPRKHPGIIKSANIALPTHISRALERVVGDHPVKALLNDCKRLQQYISARHPPPEQDELRDKMQTVIAEVDRRMPLDKLTTLNETAAEKWKRKRELAIKRLLGQRTYAWKPLSYGPYEAIVYAIGRGALEYSVLVRILQELEFRDPNFRPQSYFDFGSGVGTGMWAVSSFWKDTLYEYYNVDSSREMNEVSDLILRDGNENQQVALKNVYYRQFLPATETKYDLVVSSYTLFELPSAEKRKEVILNLWQKCDGYLIIIEEGTRRGSELVIEMRDYLLSLENNELQGHVVAPCPHNLTCPRLAAIEDRTPCNFEVSFVPLRIGDTRKDHFTARYSYVVLKKGVSQDPTNDWPRLVRPTLVRSRHVVCRMCTADAKLQEVIFTKSKHGKAAYSCAKVSRWGDRLPIAVGEPFETTENDSKKKLKTESEDQSVSNE